MSGVEDPFDDLLEDVTAMTRQAAADGLTLASVFADVRLVLDLAPGAELPPRVLRACAVAWSRSHQDLEPEADPRVLGWDQLEDRLWSGSPGPDQPRWAVLVEPGVHALGAAPAQLPPDEVLRGVAGLLAARLDRPAECVARLGPPGAPPRGLVALVAGGAGRAEQARTWVADFAPGVGAPLVTLHRVDDHPEGLLGALRAVIATVADAD